MTNKTLQKEPTLIFKLKIVGNTCQCPITTTIPPNKKTNENNVDIKSLLSVSNFIMKGGDTANFVQ